MRGWASFKNEVEAVFGLTSEQQEERFFSLRPRAGEQSAQFAVRVETERKRLNVSKMATWHAFKGYLDDPTMQVLEMVRVNKKTSGTMMTSFGWDDVVTVCKDRTSGLALTARPASTQSRAPPTRAAAPAAAAPPPQRAAQTGDQADMRPVCSLCSKLGLGGANHRRDMCFIDPNSKMYRPEVRARKVAQAKKLGLAVPPEIDIQDEPGKLNLVT